VTLRNFYVNAQRNRYGVHVASGNTGVLIEYGEIENTSSTLLYGLMGFTARYMHLHDSDGDGLKVQGRGGPVLVEYSFIEKLGRASDAHADGVQSDGGADNVTFRYNNFWMPHPGTPNYPGGSYKSNAVIFPSKPISNYVVENNWLNGGGYTVYCNPGLTVRNNYFGRDYSVGIRAQPGCVWEGNVWEDTRQPAQ
jgi:hypothetical protein